MHKCEHFLPDVPCPMMAFREEGQPGGPGIPERFAPDPEIQDEPPPFLPFVERNQRPRRKQLSTDAETVMLLRELQAAISERARRGATAVAMNQLMGQGMNTVPTFGNGGIQWMLQFLSDPAIRALFFSPQELPSGLQSGPQGSLITAFEKRSAQESKQVSERLPQNGRGLLDSFVAQVITAVAAAGGVATVALGAKALAGRVGRFAPAAPSTGRGAGGFHFQAPTFRPEATRNIVDRRKPFGFFGSPPTE